LEKPKAMEKAGQSDLMMGVHLVKSRATMLASQRALWSALLRASRMADEIHLEEASKL